MSHVTVRQAAFLTGKSRETINTACNDGKLSSSRNEQGVRIIDVAELARVYPLKRNVEDMEKPSEPVKESQVLSDSGPSDLRQQVAVLRERLEGLSSAHELVKSERERERRQLQTEIENLRVSLDRTQASLEKAQENQSKAMLMLTDQSDGAKEKERAQEQKVRELSETVETLKQQNKRIYRAFKQQRERPTPAETQPQGFWRRLFA